MKEGEDGMKRHQSRQKHGSCASLGNGRLLVLNKQTLALIRNCTYSKLK